MIDFIRTIFKEGDQIYILQNDQELGGKVLVINDSFIAIETEEGNVIGVKVDAIDGFSKQPIVRKKSVEKMPRLFASDDNWDSVPPRAESKATTAKPKKERVDFKQFKPGDKVPLDFLTKQDPTLAHAWKRMEAERSRSSKIKKAVQELYDGFVVNAEGMDQVVPAIGAIVELKPSFQFGFIDDMQTGDRYFYNRGDIVDPELQNESGEGIKVVYQRGHNRKGATARCIHLPHSIRGVMDIVMSLVREEDFFRAKMVTRSILDAYPDNEAAQRMLEALTEGDAQNATEGNGGDDAMYVQARKALEQKDYATALELYKKCMEKGIRKANCIKEIAQIYISLHAQEKDEEQKAIHRAKGLEFIALHRKDLPNKSSTNFTLENVYFALGDYENHIDVVEDIIAETGEKGDLPQYVFYLNKAAQSYLRLGDYDRALDAAEQGLEVDPHNQHLLKTKGAIEEAVADEDREPERPKVMDRVVDSFKSLFSIDEE
ncbi:MAG: tetratricopeptide repeat protein [Porphyromonas sp.]|nr:tetratricopeptide repeat protein [Porphyromonas sp.]